MPYSRWHRQVQKKAQPLTETQLAIRTTIFSAIIFGIVYWYINSTTPYSPANKAMADTAVWLMGFSMMLSSVCYFWDFLDTKIVYRKHLGLVGFAYAVVHIIISRSPLMKFFDDLINSQPLSSAVLTAAIATVIFIVMTAISNKYAAHRLGGVMWRRLLRTGYVAMILVAAHVIILKSHYWVDWLAEGPTRLPSMSLIVSVFIVLVVFMRIGLWAALRNAKR